MAFDEWPIVSKVNTECNRVTKVRAILRRSDAWAKIIPRTILLNLVIPAALRKHSHTIDIAVTTMIIMCAAYLFHRLSHTTIFFIPFSARLSKPEHYYYYYWRIRSYCPRIVAWFRIVFSVSFIYSFLVLFGVFFVRRIHNRFRRGANKINNTHILWSTPLFIPCYICRTAEFNTHGSVFTYFDLFVVVSFFILSRSRCRIARAPLTDSAYIAS